MPAETTRLNEEIDALRQVLLVRSRHLQRRSERRPLHVCRLRIRLLMDGLNDIERHPTVDRGIWPQLARRGAGLVGRAIPGYITGNGKEAKMSSSQTRAIQNYRARLSERGLARFEVLGRDADRELIRLLARRLAENSPESARIRAAVSDTINGEPAKKGGILAALRRSPLVGADIQFTRHHEEGREIEL